MLKARFIVPSLYDASKPNFGGGNILLLGIDFMRLFPPSFGYLYILLAGDLLYIESCLKGDRARMRLVRI